MNDWTSGYVAEIGYTYGYYPELNPARMRLSLLSQGILPPNVHKACELGFGQGVSVNIHAASSNIKWTGNDFNPNHAAFAQSLSEECALDIDIFDDSFAELAARNDLPQFDFIALHGIWSWISDENRKIIVRLIRDKLRVGGVVYLSYNTLPGWAAFAPVRHFMASYAETMTAKGAGVLNQVGDALGFTGKLLASNTQYGIANPSVIERLKQVSTQSRHYLAHEYFNRDWRPMYFAEVAEMLQEAKVQYAGSANYLDLIDVINLTTEQQQLLGGIHNPLFRQTTRDFMVNQQFRRDYWVKGARHIGPVAAINALRNERVILTSPKDEIPFKVSATLGEAVLSEDVYRPLVQLLGNHQPRSLGNIEALMTEHGVAWGQVFQAVQVLIGMGHLAPTQSESQVQDAREPSRRLNNHLLDQALTSADLNFLASPVTGGGVSIGRPQQLFLIARKKEMATPNDWATFTWSVLSSQGQRLLKEGRVLETEAENRSELQSLAEQFERSALPILRSLEVV